MTSIGKEKKKKKQSMLISKGGERKRKKKKTQKTTTLELELSTLFYKDCCLGSVKNQNS